MFSCLCKHKASASWTLPGKKNADTPKERVITNGEASKEILEDDEGGGKRRTGLAAPAINTEKLNEIVKHPKQKEDEELIKAALTKNNFLRNLLEGSRLQAVVDAMYSKGVEAGEVIIQQGNVGSHMYVSGRGSYEIIIGETPVDTFQDSRVFGELAILYNAKRQATIRATTQGLIWILDGDVFQQTMLRNALEKREQLLSFLRNVTKLNKKSEETLGRVADLLNQEFYHTGAVIVRQGDRGDKFFIIAAGTVTISKEGEGDISKMKSGEFFGQLALLKEEYRQATVTADAPGVECMTLSREDFIEHFGDLENIEDIPEPKPRQPTEPILKTVYEDIELKDLEMIGTLGVGGFGRVELVQHRTKKELTFALKYLKKVDMIHQHQETHAFNEKNIQMGCNSIFIVRMYKTFKDSKYLYFLMESCLGGDLWTLLQKQRNRRFEENTSRFYAGSVLEAFAYLHERGIVYRDLKPENLLLDTEGYLKLTDFGFAKKLDTRGKAFTFAGTPEYVPPEIVLNRGHDKAADYWTLGIFVFELLSGRTPFRSNDSNYQATYSAMLRGIERVRFPDPISHKAEHLIKRLCRLTPSQRIGCQKDGAQAVRDHKWFMGFEWERLCRHQLKAPIVRKLRSNTDMQYIEKFKADLDIPPDENSGWDHLF